MGAAGAGHNRRAPTENATVIICATDRYNLTLAGT